MAFSSYILITLSLNLSIKMIWEIPVNTLMDFLVHVHPINDVGNQSVYIITEITPISRNGVIDIYESTFNGQIELKILRLFS